MTGRLFLCTLWFESSGTFDGVHLGHLSLIHRLRSLVSEKGLVLVYTFTNHPTYVLSHLPTIPFIYTLEHKCKILQEHNVDYTILSTFTKEFAETPFAQFLTNLKNKFHFSYLILGEGASFGKNREGNKENIQKLSKQLDFQVEYLPKLYIDGEPISSGRIRTLIAEGKFSLVEQCLGRPYSILAPLLLDKEHYHLSLDNVCLPPSAIYPVHILIGNTSYEGHAHIDRHSEKIRIDFVNPPSHYHTTLVEVIFLPT